MSKRNEFSNLVGHLSGKASAGVRTPATKSLGGSTSLSARSTVRPPKTDGLRSESFTSENIRSSGLHFGSPSSNSTQRAANSNPWKHLLTQKMSSELLHGFGGGGGLMGVTGLGSLISGLVGLFGGGRKTPPPLQLFQLPGAQNDSISISSHPASAGPVYGEISSASTAHGSSGAPSYQAQSAEVAQAVKVALLNSSSLSDVIAEL